MPFWPDRFKIPTVRSGPNALPFVGALDDYSTGLAGAWSVARRLLSSYKGPLIRVRRSSDSEWLDIFAAADGTLDVASLLAFCGSGSGYVAKVYHENGGSDLEQATAERQPRIVNAGALETLGGKPAAIFDGSNDFMEVSITQAQPWSMHLVWRDSVATGYAVAVGQTGNASAVGIDPGSNLYCYGSTGFERNITRGVPTCDQVIADSVSSKLFRGGAQLGADGNTNAAFANTTYLASNGTIIYAMDFSELILWAAAVPSSLAALYADAADFYSL